MRIELIHIWRSIGNGLGWNVVGRSLCHTLHSVNFRSMKSMASSWNAEETKAADTQNQLGVMRSKTIYMKVSVGMAELGYDSNNILQGYFNSW